MGRSCCCNIGYRSIPLWNLLPSDSCRIRYVFPVIGLAAIFLFAGANVLPTSKNNKKYIENQLERSIQQMETYIQKYPDFPVPAYYAHPIVLKRMQDIMKDGRAQTIPEALTVLKDDLKALNSNVTVEKKSMMKSLRSNQCSW